jgi:hypothetical protein
MEKLCETLQAEMDDETTAQCLVFSDKAAFVLVTKLTAVICMCAVLLIMQPWSIRGESLLCKVTKPSLWPIFLC